jgi:hypothetical protein
MKKQQTFGPKSGASYEAIAKARWPVPPDWVLVLARHADKATSQGELAKRLEVNSASLISAVIGNKYKGRLSGIEAKVRGKLMSATVACPVLGVIGRDACADFQSRKFSAANPQLVKLRRACPGCPNALEAK